jgi:hypothetical protein
MEPWHELQHSIIQIDFIQAGISEQTSMKTTINMENTQKHKNTKTLHTTFMVISNQEEIPDTKEHGDFNQDWIPKTHKPKHKDLHAMTDYKNFMTIDRARIEQLNPWRLF